jgi:hypothetical protein
MERLSPTMEELDRHLAGMIGRRVTIEQTFFLPAIGRAKVPVTGCIFTMRLDNVGCSYGDVSILDLFSHEKQPHTRYQLIIEKIVEWSRPDGQQIVVIERFAVSIARRTVVSLAESDQPGTAGPFDR